MRRGTLTTLIAATAVLVGGSTLATTSVGATSPSEPVTTESAAVTNESAPASVTTESAPDSTIDPAITVRPGPGQIALLGARPGEEWVVRGNGVETSAVVDELGSALWRHLDPGDYSLTGPNGTGSYTVTDFDTPPDKEFYGSQVLPAGGFGYVTTRDGTTLSVNTILPGPIENGPYPTVVEYSGYSPSNPDAGLGLATLYSALGYAYVGVNIRGSGCSGGSFDYFEDIQRTDGYDVIETVAAQPWVANNKVGMVGISYSGISQLYVASTRPPSLEAITPLSVLDDATRFTLYPGAILNNGFALDWSKERDAETTPFGQDWTKTRADGGDLQCAANQNLRLQNPGLENQIYDNPFYVADLGERLAPNTFVDQINVPVFLAGAWQDEQTGPHFATMLDRFTGTDHFYVSITNGLHTESISPAIVARYVSFLDLYVGKRAPSLDVLQGLVPVLGTAIFGTDQLTVPPSPYAGMSYDDALAAFEAEDPIQLGIEEGAAPGQPPRTPMPRSTVGFDAWPIPGAETVQWFLAADGALTDTAPTGAQEPTSYTADPTAVPQEYFDESNGGNIWSVDVSYDWVPNPAGTAAVFTSEPFGADTFVAGSGRADLWIAADAADTDLEVTITEVRPDGNEVLVQSGWLRASRRRLDTAASSPLVPVPSGTEADVQPLVPGELVEASVGIYPFAHPFRAGSRLRVTIDAPGGNRQIWAFDTISNGETVTIAHDGGHPSSISLAVVPGVAIPEGYPECGALRGQPCRPDPAP